MHRLIVSLSLGFELVVISAFLLSCKNADYIATIVIKNSTPTDRTLETIEIPLHEIDENKSLSFSDLIVTDTHLNKEIPSQLEDVDGDDRNDILIFQVNIAKNSEKNYRVGFADSSLKVKSKVFSRFVPERLDDYAWENDRVAFRTYGPASQKKEEEQAGTGTISSGMDCWLKKVDYLIINKWYKKHEQGGSYHEDDGEGLDNYHVGKSRGCGGLGYWDGKELYNSKNFNGYKTIYKGPIRAGFILEYEDWNAVNSIITETKFITLDKGSNLMKVTAEIKGVDRISVGMTLHENEGIITQDTLAFWCNYWQPHANSELNTAIVCDSKYYLGMEKISVEEDSHILVHLKVIDGKVEYYTGFSWKESGQFSSDSEWFKYLTNYAFNVKNPLNIEFRR